MKKEPLSLPESELVDALLNMLGAFDTPVRRMKYPSDFGDEVIEIAKAALHAAGYKTPGEL